MPINELVLLLEIPESLEVATRLIEKQWKFWKAIGSTDIHENETKLCSITVDVNIPDTSFWAFRVIFCQNPYTHDVYGLIKDRNYSQNCSATWGVCRLTNPTDMCWSARDDYIEYKGYLKDADGDAYREWLKLLTTP
jgi:hypothetical protein